MFLHLVKFYSGLDSFFTGRHFMWIIEIYWKYPNISKLASLVFMLIYFTLISWKVSPFSHFKNKLCQTKVGTFQSRETFSPYHLPYGVRLSGPIVIPRHYHKALLIYLLSVTYVRRFWLGYKGKLGSLFYAMSVI